MQLCENGCRSSRSEMQDVSDGRFTKSDNKNAEEL